MDGIVEYLFHVGLTSVITDILFIKVCFVFLSVIMVFAIANTAITLYLQRQCHHTGQ